MFNHIFDLHAFPINTVLIPSIIGNGCFTAKSAISLNVAGENKVILSGFSYDHDSDKAKYISRFELLEHLFATAILHKPSDVWNGYNIYDPADKKSFPTYRVLLGNFPNVPYHMVADSSGLAIHTELSSAITHAVYEIIERHILSEIWFTNSRKIYLRKDQYLGVDDLQLKTYSVANLPFTISFALSKKYKLAFAGSSFSDEIETSEKKSENEALMLLEACIAGNNKHCFSKGTSTRLKSSTNRDYYDAIISMISVMSSNDECESTQDFDLGWGVLNNFLSDIYVVSILTTENIKVVRAISDRLFTLKYCRFIYKDKILYDPFF